MLTLCLIYRGRLAILLGGYCDEAKVGRLNRSADMFVLLLWEQATQHFCHPRGTAI
jgi:hypothetical protein